jgi:hypothetical protein
MVVEVDGMTWKCLCGMKFNNYNEAVIHTETCPRRIGAGMRMLFQIGPPRCEYCGNVLISGECFCLENY